MSITTRIIVVFDSKIQRQRSSKSNKLTIAAMVAAIAGSVLVPSPRAEALPSFARQTGLSCGGCHTDFPQLTPLGRKFKLGGYTMGGGRESDQYKKTFGSNQWVPPLSVMGVASFSQTKTSQDANGTNPSNNYFALNQGSLFYGGAITEELGAFVQGTIADGGNASTPSSVSLDNTDVRYVKKGTLFGKDAIFGITAHNNPTVQDVWNTVPAWSFPFMSSSFAPSPMAATAIEGAFSGKVLGVGVYTFINDMFYLEATAYKGFNRRLQSVFGVIDNSVMDRVSPYVRVAAEPHWGNHWLMVGAFWLSTSVNPQYVDDPNNSAVFSGGNNKFVDLGFDSQYQYMGKNFVLTLRGVYIHEKQKLDAFFNNGMSDNPTNTLNSFKAQASYAWNTDALGNKWVFTGGYFNTWGSSDCGLYNGTVGGCNSPPVDSGGSPVAITNSLTGSPNSDGWIAEIAWFPYAMSNSPLWPYFNTRIGLHYVWYNKFNGASSNYDGYGRNAKDNNTLFAYLWFAM
jgi:hypothetical protein